jgi:hypothetical protein
VVPWFPTQVISFEQDAGKARLHWDQVQKEELYNNIVGVTPTNEDYMTKFMECPEFLRYQAWRG